MSSTVRSKQLAPLILRPWAVLRLVVDKDAPRVARALAVASIAYLVWPIDLVPDLMPVFGWLDDVGFVGAAMAYLLRELARYERDKQT